MSQAIAVGIKGDALYMVGGAKTFTNPINVQAEMKFKDYHTSGSNSTVTTETATYAPASLALTGAEPQLELHGGVTPHVSMQPGNIKGFGVQVTRTLPAVTTQLYFKKVVFTVTVPVGLTVIDGTSGFTYTSGQISNISYNAATRTYTLTTSAFYDKIDDVFFRVQVDRSPAPSVGDSWNITGAITSYDSYDVTGATVASTFVQAIKYAADTGLGIGDATNSDVGTAYVDISGMASAGSGATLHKDMAYLGSYFFQNATTAALTQGWVRLDFTTSFMGVRMVRLPGASGISVAEVGYKLYDATTGVITNNAGTLNPTQIAAAYSYSSGGYGVFNLNQINVTGGNSLSDHAYITHIKYSYTGVAAGYGGGDFTDLPAQKTAIFGRFIDKRDNSTIASTLLADSPMTVTISQSTGATDPGNWWDLTHDASWNVKKKSVANFITEVISSGGGGKTSTLTGGNRYGFKVEYKLSLVPGELAADGSEAPAYYVNGMQVYVRGFNVLHPDNGYSGSGNMSYVRMDGTTGGGGSLVQDANGENMWLNGSYSSTTASTTLSLSYCAQGDEPTIASGGATRKISVSFNARVEKSAIAATYDMRDVIFMKPYVTTASYNVGMRAGGIAGVAHYNQLVTSVGSSTYTPPAFSDPIGGGGSNTYATMKASEGTFTISPLTGFIISPMEQFREWAVNPVTGWQDDYTGTGVTPYQLKLHPFTQLGGKTAGAYGYPQNYGQFEYRTGILNNTGNVVNTAEFYIPIPKRDEIATPTAGVGSNAQVGNTAGTVQAFEWSASIHSPLTLLEVSNTKYDITYATTYAWDDASAYGAWNAASSEDYRMIRITLRSGQTIAQNETARFRTVLRIAEERPEDWYKATNIYNVVGKIDGSARKSIATTNSYLKTATVKGVTYSDWARDQDYRPWDNDVLLSGIPITAYTGANGSGTAYITVTTDAEGFYSFPMFEDTNTPSIMVTNPFYSSDSMRFGTHTLQRLQFKILNVADFAAGQLNTDDERQPWERPLSMTNISFERACMLYFVPNSQIIDGEPQGATINGSYDWLAYPVWRTEIFDQSKLDGIVAEWEGYTFMGWHEGSANGRKLQLPIFIVNDMYVYARWQANPYKLTYWVGNEATVYPNAMRNEIIGRVNTPAPEVSSSERYEFLGWRDDTGAMVDPMKTRMPARDYELFAVFRDLGTGSASASPESTAPSSVAPEPPVSSEPPAPLPTNSNWSIVSVVLTVLGGLLAIVALLMVLQRQGANLFFKVLTLAAGILTVPVLLLMNDFSAAMRIANFSTVIIAVLVIIAVAFVLVAVGRARKDDDVDEDAAYYA